LIGGHGESNVNAVAVASRDRQRPRFLRFALALVLTTAVVGTVATAAYAFTDYVSETSYANGLSLGPGGYVQTGFNYRTEKRRVPDR
jgi:hypothetical protein